MEYREFKRLGVKTSLLGFGCMRLPTLTGPADIDEREAVCMIRHGIDRGINYVDTAWGYHEEMSQPLVAKALADGYRQKTYLATKLPCWLVTKPEDLDFYLNEQLRRCGTDHIDFYLLHALDRGRWDNLMKVDVLHFLERAKRDGRIRFAGFSFHDKLDTFKTIVDAYPFDMAQIQLNYLDQDLQAGLEGMRYAAKRGTDVVAMEPLKGGQLTSRLPQKALEILEASHENLSPAAWAFKWVAHHPEIKVILSGMSSMEQLEENLRIFEDLPAQNLTALQEQTLEKVRTYLNSRIKVPCTDCQYCLPCPHNVFIPKIFEQYNRGSIFGDYTGPRGFYRSLVDDGQDVSACVACGACEAACPQHLPIAELLKQAHEVLR